MRRPQIIGLASIIPGLGFLLLGDRRRAAQAFLLVLIAGGIAYTIQHATSIPVVQAAGLGVLLVPWYVQGMWAANSARLLEKRQENPARQAKETNMDEVSGSSFSQGQARLERVEEIAIQQLEPDEDLLAVVEVGGTDVEETPQARIEHPFQSYYLALTETDLLIMEADWSGAPITVDRVPREQIEEIHYLPGFKVGSLSLKIAGKEMPEYQVGSAFFEEVQLLYDEIKPHTMEMRAEVAPRAEEKEAAGPSDLPDKGKHSAFSRLEIVRQWFLTAPIGKVQGVIAGGAFAIFLVTSIVASGFDASPIPEPWNWILIGTMVLMMGLSFVPGIIRREFYWSHYKTLRGPSAVVLGGIFAGILILTGLYLIIGPILTP